MTPSPVMSPPATPLAVLRARALAGLAAGTPTAVERSPAPARALDTPPAASVITQTAVPAPSPDRSLPPEFVAELTRGLKLACERSRERGSVELDVHFEGSGEMLSYRASSDGMRFPDAPDDAAPILTWRDIAGTRSQIRWECAGRVVLLIGAQVRAFLGDIENDLQFLRVEYGADASLLSTLVVITNACEFSNL